jgi:hypothetical protein
MVPFPITLAKALVSQHKPLRDDVTNPHSHSQRRAGGTGREHVCHSVSTPGKGRDRGKEDSASNKCRALVEQSP